MPRPFDEYRQGVVQLALEAVVAALLAALPAAALGGLIAGAPGAAAGFVAGYVWGSLEFGVLAGNRRLRQAVVAKLQGYGRAVETGDDRFVGLAYPAFFQTNRRQVETDDDVGFLTVDAEGLTFLGDGIEFRIPAVQIAAVRVRRDPHSFFLSRRVEVTTRDGEPQEVVLFDSRDRWPHSACNLDNQRLYREIQRLIRPASEQPRLVTAEREADAVLDA
ncbi:MAG: hypothetical protein IT204_24550 [Fimbriimonadaceae bacterium]|nr:hypothetical protein [Fimbriimonadaceae bacterium]